ncbi:hypothetical protein BH18ACT1_BH18ACT1_00130 [soil metagenome]
MYAHQRPVGGSKYYQLESLDRLSRQAGSPVDPWSVYRDAVELAVDQGASYVEIRRRDYRYDLEAFRSAIGPLVPGLRANAEG